MERIKTFGVLITHNYIKDVTGLADSYIINIVYNNISHLTYDDNLADLISEIKLHLNSYTGLKNPPTLYETTYYTRVVLKYLIKNKTIITNLNLLD